MAGASGTRTGSVHSVDRAISIMQILARLGTAGVTEIAAELDVHKSTVSRLLGTLEGRGLVVQGSHRGRYRLGHGVVQLAEGATRKHDLSMISRPICQELAETVGETVNVAIHDGDTVVSIDQVIGTAIVTTMNWVGQRTPLHATSAGKVFLAHLPAGDLDRVLTAGLARFTDHTVTDPAALEVQLAQVRAVGYSHTLEEHEVGLAAVAAPIRSLDGDVIAALTISGPTFRLHAETIPALAPYVVSAATEISERNGFPKRG